LSATAPRAYAAKMSKREDHAQQRTEQAEDRTDWAQDRTILANERTFNSWMGTGLGCIGVAIALRAVFGAFEPTWAAKLVASTFLLIAVLIFWSARNRAHETHERLNSTDAKPIQRKNFTRLAIVMTTATLLVGAILWML